MKMNLALTVAMLAAMPVTAATIDFDTSTIFLNAGQSGPVDEGFTVTLSDPGDFMFAVLQEDIFNNGTKGLFLANFGNWTLTETAPSMDGFDFLSLDIGGSFLRFPERWAESVTFVGTKVLGGTVSFNYALDPALTAFANVALPGSFSGLQSVQFVPTINPNLGPNNYEFVVDNLVVQASDGAVVPEPTSWALMIAGFGLVGSALRRSRGVAAA